MLVVHTGEFGGSLFAWCEESPEGTPGFTPRSERTTGPSPHPFGADGVRLAESLRGAPLCFNTSGERSCRMNAWLPTRGSIPVPSTALIADLEETEATLRIAPWLVAAHRVSPEEAVRLLASAFGKRTLAPGVIVGTDTAYWAEALRFAASLVARQRFLPGLVTGTDGYRAVWSPVFTGEDEEHLAGLVGRMPAAARALTETGDMEAPARGSGEVLEEVIGALTDHLVRLGASRRSQRPTSDRRSDVSINSSHDSWIGALTSENGVVRGDMSELAQLSAQVGIWRRPIEASASFPFRLCFRLDEPTHEAESDDERDGDSDDSWFVRYLLQSREDPSLLIPAGDAWREEASATTSLVGAGSNLSEFLLSSMGQAAGICPAIAVSLEAGDLDGYLLDTIGAHEFLIRDSLALRQADFGVLLPAWWTSRGTKMRPRARANVRTPAMESIGGISLDTVLQFDWELSLGDRKLSLEELETLARLKMPLVRVRGQWVEVNDSEIQEAIDFWKRRAGEATVREVVMAHLGAGDIPEWVDPDGVRSSGWVGDLLTQLEGHSDFEELASPTGFSGTLRPYQVRGYSWLSFLRQWGLGACLADDMGLGKTVQTLALIQRDWQVNGHRPVLLVCPTSVLNNWRKEASRFTPELPVLVHHGPDRSRGSAFNEDADRHAIVVTSYGLLNRDSELLRQHEWGGIVLDEAQNVKNHQTKQSRGSSLHRGRLPYRTDRDARREQRGRSLVDYGVPEPWLPWYAGRVQA